MRIGVGVGVGGMFHCALSCSQTQNKARGKHSLLCDIDSRRENREFVCISVSFIAQERRTSL